MMRAEFGHDNPAMTKPDLDECARNIHADAMGLIIDLSAIVANWHALGRLAPGARVAAVVKADAYGLGAAQVAPALYAAGARDFFVAVASEGRAIRPLLPQDAQIFVLSGHMEGEDLTGLTPVLNSLDQFFRDRAIRPGGPFGIQLDTGMNRLGLEAGEWAAIRAEALAAGPALIMSHLACADAPDHPANAQQLAAFHAMTDGTNVPRSLAATGGILLGAEYQFDLVRPGIGLYGGQPFADGLAVVRLSLPVIQTREVQAGESVGYGYVWTASRRSRVATVAAGYADGLARALMRDGDLQLWAASDVGADDVGAAIAVPVIGRISMDLITVDVTDLPDLPHSLEILNAVQGVDDLAALSGTIGYEILTSLGKRYPRKWI